MLGKSGLKLQLENNYQGLKYFHQKIFGLRKIEAKDFFFIEIDEFLFS